jgi:hypothetical protein
MNMTATKGLACRCSTCWPVAKRTRAKMRPTCERVWRDLKDALAWLQFLTLDAQQDYLATLLRAYEAATLQTLTSYTYLVEAIHGLDS